MAKYLVNVSLDVDIEVDDCDDDVGAAHKAFGVLWGSPSLFDIDVREIAAS